MKDILIRLSAHANQVAAMLATLDRSALAKGQLIISQSFLNQLAVILSDESLKFQNVTLNDDGTVCLSVQAGKQMNLFYRMKIDTFRMADGRAEGIISYQEERKNAGIGGALLHMTGKSGLAVALGKYPWLRVNDQTIQLQKNGLPSSVRIQFVSAGRGGLLFRTN